MKMKSETYDKLKHIAWIVAPLLTLIAAICNIWGVEYADKITATAAAIDTFIGSLVAVSNYNYNKENSDDV